MTAPVVLPAPRVASIRARAVRRSAEIHAYVGANGGGKSMCAVFDSLPSLARGRLIVSTVRILDPRTGEPHPLWVPLDDFRILADPDLGRCDVILDEVTGVASAREHSSLPAAVGNRLMQLRRADITLRWTAPNWKRADTYIREVTKGVTTCVGFVKQEAPPDPEHPDDERLWKSRRLFLWRTYDTRAFDEWTTAKERSNKSGSRARCIARQWAWRDHLAAKSAYDTFDSVLSLGVVSDGGTCMDCGAVRPRPRCGCDKRRSAGEDVTRAESEGMAVLRQLRHPPPAVVVPETDDTPAVMLAPAAP